MNLNVVVIGGRLTRDPEVKFLPSGTALVTGAIALNRRFQQGDEWKERPVFIEFVMFGRRGEAFAKHHRKGDPAIFSQASLDMDEWPDRQTGQKRTKLKLVVDSWEFAGGRREAAGEPTQATTTESPTEAGEETPF